MPLELYTLPLQVQSKDKDKLSGHRSTLGWSIPKLPSHSNKRKDKNLN